MGDVVDLTAVIPILNEEDHIEQCVESLMCQDYPLDKVEILLVDGCSTDKTPEKLEQLQQRHPSLIRVLNNPQRIQAAAMNIGMRHARGAYLMRLDAHAEYPETYFRTCIDLLNTKDAQNAGCGWITTAKTKTGRLIAKVLSSSFAVGGSSFRVDAESGYVDTVPFGTFRTAYLKEIGGFDERLARSEDNEINYRIRKRGDKIYLTNEIHTTYYCRDSISSLAEQAYANGKWNVIAAHLCPGSMSPKYFVPLTFVASLIVLPILARVRPRFWAVLGAELTLYFTLALYSSLSQTRDLREVVRMIWLYPSFHIPYGIGSIVGLWDVLTKRGALASGTSASTSATSEVDTPSLSSANVPGGELA